MQTRGSAFTETFHSYENKDSIRVETKNQLELTDLTVEIRYTLFAFIFVSSHGF